MYVIVPDVQDGFFVGQFISVDFGEWGWLLVKVCIGQVDPSRD